MELGEYIKKARKRKGMTARELSRQSGVSKSYLSQLETGKNDKPSHEIIEKLASTLDVNVADLYDVSGHFGSERLNRFSESIKKSLDETSKKMPDNFNVDKIDALIFQFTRTAMDSDKEIKRRGRVLERHEVLFLGSMYDLIREIDTSELSTKQLADISDAVTEKIYDVLYRSDI